MQCWNRCSAYPLPWGKERDDRLRSGESPPHHDRTRAPGVCRRLLFLFAFGQLHWLTGSIRHRRTGEATMLLAGQILTGTTTTISTQEGRHAAEDAAQGPRPGARGLWRRPLLGGLPGRGRPGRRRAPPGEPPAGAAGGPQHARLCWLEGRRLPQRHRRGRPLQRAGDPEGPAHPDCRNASAAHRPNRRRFDCDRAFHRMW